jgi:hypothetical protein
MDILLANVSCIFRIRTDSTISKNNTEMWEGGAIFDSHLKNMESIAYSVV